MPIRDNLPEILPDLAKETAIFEKLEGEPLYWFFSADKCLIAQEMLLIGGHAKVTSAELRH